MKKFISCILISFCFVSLFAAKKSKKTVKVEEKTQPAIVTESAKEENNSSKYYKNGYSGEVTTLVILEPEGQNIQKENEWLLSFIQTQLIDNFTVCSPIIISDRQNADKAQNEIGIQENGSFDEEKIGATFGEAVGASYMLTGQLTDMGTAYNLSLRINDITKNISITSVKKSQFGITEIKNGTIINQATEELLNDLGVELTSAGREKLYGIDEQTLKQQESLSKGINASKRGTVVEAMQYYYAAAEYNIDNTEVYSRLNALQTAVSTGNIGDMARNEDDVYDYWKKTLKEAEKFFADHPPYEIIYSTDLQRLERTKEELENKENSISIRIGLITSNSAKNTITTLKKGINDSPTVVKNVLSEWPQESVDGVSNKWLYPNNYSIQVDLINSLGKVISTAETDLSLIGPRILDQKNIELYHLNDLNKLYFTHVKSNDLTDDLTIRVKSIVCNYVNIPTDFIKISTVEGFKEPIMYEERLELERIAEEKRLAKIEEEKRAREKQREELKEKVVTSIKDYLKHNRRDSVTISVVDKFNEYNSSIGVKVDVNKPIFSHLYYGINGSYNKVEDSWNSFDAQFTLGLNFYDKNKKNAIFTNAGIGYAKKSVAGSGLLLSATLGFDIKCFELAYSIQYLPFDFGLFNDEVSVGLFVKLN